MCYTDIKCDPKSQKKNFTLMMEKHDGGVDGLNEANGG